MTPESPLRRGPNLPYSLVAGVTPCRGGWLVAGAKLQGTIFSPEDPVRIDSFVDVVDMRPGVFASSPSMPRWEASTRPQLAAEAATAKRGSSSGAEPSAVKSAPVAVDSPEGTELLPDNIDAISRTLLPRYQEVAREMAPFRQRTIYEVNADLSFFQLNDDVPMRWSKYSEKGVTERRSLVESKMPGALRIIDSRGSRSAPRRTSSMQRRSSGRPGGSSPRPPSGSRASPNGTSKGCGWSSFGRRRLSALRLAMQIRW